MQNIKKNNYQNDYRLSKRLSTFKMKIGNGKWFKNVSRGGVAIFKKVSIDSKLTVN